MSGVGRRFASGRADCDSDMPTTISSQIGSSPALVPRCMFFRPAQSKVVKTFQGVRPNSLPMFGACSCGHAPAWRPPGGVLPPRAYRSRPRTAGGYGFSARTVGGFILDGHASDDTKNGGSQSPCGYGLHQLATAASLDVVSLCLVRKVNTSRR